MKDDPLSSNLTPTAFPHGFLAYQHHWSSRSGFEVIKAIKKAIREPLKELERDPAFYAYIGAILGVFVLIFRMFANVWGLTGGTSLILWDKLLDKSKGKMIHIFRCIKWNVKQRCWRPIFLNCHVPNFMILILHVIQRFADSLVVSV